MKDDGDDAAGDGGGEDGDEAAPVHVPHDCPCIRCGYNLRGIPPEGNCPECGCAVGRTMRMLEERVLCPRCLTPMHPSTVTCEKCGAPMSSAGMMASYYSARATAAAPFETGAPSRGGLILLYVILVPLLTFSLQEAWKVGMDRGVAGLLCMGVCVAALTALLYFATRSYWRAKKRAAEENVE